MKAQSGSDVKKPTKASKDSLEPTMQQLSISKLPSPHPPAATSLLSREV